MPHYPPKRIALSSYLKNSRWQWSALIFWAITLAVLSLAPSSRLPKIHSWSDLITVDKFAHALVYAIFAVLLYQVLKTKVNSPKLLALFIAASYGAFMEFLQHISATGRTYEFADMIANTAGALLAMVLCNWWENAKTK